MFNLTTISAYSIASNVATFTVPSGTAPTTGTRVELYAFPASTFLNNKWVTVTTSSATQFTANFTYANASATEAGAATTNFAISSSNCVDAMGSSPNYLPPPTFQWRTYNANDIIIWSPWVNDVLRNETSANYLSTANEEDATGCTRAAFNWIEVPAAQQITGVAGIASGAITYTGDAPTNNTFFPGAGGIQLALGTTSLTIGANGSLVGSIVDVTLDKYAGSPTLYTIAIDGQLMVNPGTGTTSFPVGTTYVGATSDVYEYTAEFGPLSDGRHTVVITPIAGNANNYLVLERVSAYDPSVFKTTATPRILDIGMTQFTAATYAAQFGTAAAGQEAFALYETISQAVDANAANNGMKISHVYAFTDNVLNPATQTQSDGAHWTAAGAASVANAVVETYKSQSQQ